MLETHLKSPVTRSRLRAGPAADHIDGFADWLRRCGYAPTTIDWMLRCPNPYRSEGNVEIRQLFGMEDFGEAVTPEIRDQIDRMHAATGQ